LVQMTLAPKTTNGEPKSIEPRAVVNSEGEVGSLWNEPQAQVSADPWSVATGGGLPDLPGHYGTPPDLDEEPF